MRMKRFHGLHSSQTQRCGCIAQAQQICREIHGDLPLDLLLISVLRKQPADHRGKRFGN